MPRMWSPNLMTGKFAKPRAWWDVRRAAPVVEVGADGVEHSHRNRGIRDFLGSSDRICWGGRESEMACTVGAVCGRGIPGADEWRF
jgi:hypothetical protein